MAWKFIKAVPVTDAKAIVYAFQVTEADFTFSHGFLGREKEKVCALELYGEIYFVALGDWLVYFPLEVGFDFIPDVRFQEHYTIYDALPPNVRALADKHPSYDEWVDRVDQEAAMPRQ